MENNFLVQYFLDRGLYNCTKSEYEQVIFYCLVKEKFPELNFYQCSAEEIYAIGETLNLDVQKVNKLLRGIPYIKGCQNIQKPEFIDVLCKNILLRLQSQKGRSFLCDQQSLGKRNCPKEIF